MLLTLSHASSTAPIALACRPRCPRNGFLDEHAFSHMHLIPILLYGPHKHTCTHAPHHSTIAPLQTHIVVFLLGKASFKESLMLASLLFPPACQVFFCFDSSVSIVCYSHEEKRPTQTESAIKNEVEKANWEDIARKAPSPFTAKPSGSCIWEVIVSENCIAFFFFFFS